jgi:HEXXH motif-containing protein
MPVGECDSLAERARLFALPGAQNSAFELLDDIVATYADSLTAEFLLRYEQKISTESDGLVAFLKEGASNGFARRLKWQVELGFVRDNLLSGARHCTPLESAALLALAFVAVGQSGSWECHFPEPVRLRSGKILLPQARGLSLSAGHDSVQIILDGSSCELQRLPGRDGIAAGKWAAMLATVDIGDRVVCLLPRKALPRNVLADQRFVLDEVQSEHSGRVRSAIDLLGRHVPMYLDWIKGPLQDLVLLNGTDGRLRSGSFKTLPGMIYLSAVDHPARMAEMLIHETSHQYFHVLSLVGDVDDGSDTAEHFSPVVKEGRSIRMVLFAYHAFANVLRFYRLYRDAVGATPSLERDSAEIEGDVRKLEMILAQNSSLTPLGHSIFDSLRSTLR